MKHIFLIISTLFMTTAVTFGQEKGVVTVNNSAKLDSLVYANSASQQIQPGITSQGFRVQIYSSNRNQIAKAGAFKVEKEFVELFPEIHAYVTYTAPFWKVRVGDFSSYYEALTFSNKIKDTFPERATEVFVVKEDNIKPVYFNIIPTEPQDL